MKLREMHHAIDGEQLTNFDTSFVSHYIYRLTVNALSVEITEEKLDVPFQNIYPFHFIKKDIDEADFAVVAEIEDKTIAGFAVAKFEEWNKRVVLTEIFVAPEYRGKLIGRALIDAVIEYAKTTFARCLWLETQNVNYPAIQFYRKIGFEFCGFDSALYNPADVSSGEIAFYFCKDLSK
ncbi:MAG: GNAT family N-acetyltransferase [Acidobacteriota bacterium]|nr:GNAT family N-acetyltransferase [Acidobacteriota bacterium]